MNTRSYKNKDVEMLLASRTITTNLSDNIKELSLVRTNWTDEYVTTLQGKINNAIENYLGLDKKKELRNATATVLSIQATAKREVSFLKTQIEVDFPGTKNQILKELGFDINFRKVQNNDQEALIQLLYALKKGMTDELKNQIIDKGTSPALIDKIIDYANALNEANIEQEVLKESTKNISKEALDTFNEIYNEIIGICKIASRFYQYDEVKKAMFTYTKIVAAMSAGVKSKSEKTAEE